MTTPEEAVREANPRFVVFADDPSGLRLDIDAMLDAARADGVSAERARLAARVSEMRMPLTERKPFGQLPSEWRDENEEAVTHNDALDAVLALLREAP